MIRIKKMSKFGLMCICILFFTVFWKPITANAQNEAEDMEADKPDQDGIVKIITAYTDESGNIYYAKQGTGFVVGITNNDSRNKKYVVSDYGNVQGEAVYLDAIRKKYGLSEEVKLTITYYAIGNMGVLSDLKIYSYSNETRYVVLETDSPLEDKDCLKLGNGDYIEKEGRIHIEGYSGARNIVTDTAVNERSIKVYDTIITDVTTENYYNDVITYFYVGELIDEGMAGAPVFDKNGCVVGMFIMQNGNIKAISIENIRIILDALDIKYLIAEDDTTYDVPTQKQVDELKKLIVDNKEYISSISKNMYTDKTWNALYTAISKADSVYLNSNSTAKQYDDSIIELTKARKKLKTKAFKWKLINIIAGIVGLILVLIFVKNLNKRTKINAQKKKIKNVHG